MRLIRPISLILLVLGLVAGGFLLYQRFSPARNASNSVAGGQTGKVSTIATLAAPAPKLEPIPNLPNSPYLYQAQITPNTEALFAEKDSTKPSYEIKQGDYSLKFTLQPDSTSPVIPSASEGSQDSESRDSSASPQNDKGKKVSDNVIEYAVTIQGIPMTLRHTTTSTGVKEEFIIAKKPFQNTSGEPGLTPEVGSQLKIPFQVENSGFQIKDNGDGGYTLTNPKTQESLTIQPPTLIDAKGKTGQITASLFPVIPTSPPVIPAKAGIHTNNIDSGSGAGMTNSGVRNDESTYTLSLPTSYLATATYPVVIDPTVIINTSSTTAATSPSTMRHIVRTSDGTLHSFLQVGTQTATCGGSSKSGLLWFSSTDSGSTWTCQSQLSSDTTNLMYADARADSSDNIYAVYSVAPTGASASYDVFYRKLTKGAGASWTLESAQTVLDASASIGYSGAAIELQGTTRLWLVVKYYDGANYNVSVHYSDGLGAVPVWTQSAVSLSTSGGDTSGRRFYSMIVRFGSKIGIITIGNNWRAFHFRNDSDALTDWSSLANTPGFTDGTNDSAVGDTNGNIYHVYNDWNANRVLFQYFNGNVWLPAIIISSSTGAGNSQFMSVATDGTNAYIFYSDTTGLSSGLSGFKKLFYKKCVPPFTASDCDATATSVVSYHGVFDKAWSYVASAYTDITTAAGNTTSADTQMVTSTGDIAYFGKSTTFDAISWDVSTAGNSGGAITWEYCSAVDGSTACTTWSALSFTSQTSAAASEFEADGYGAFTTPGDWVAAKVNSEDTAYYYIRARATASYTTSPVGVQMASIPQINWANATATVASNTIHAVWTENAVSPTRVRYASISATASTAPAGTAGIAPNTIAYSSSITATQLSTMRHIVRTSDGTLHAFIQGGTQLTCGGATGSNNVGLNWLYSTDSGSTWTCGGQLSSDTTNLMYADARVDSSNNIYVVYSFWNVAIGGANANYDVYYQKLTKGTGAAWTLETVQKVLDASASTAYNAAVLELEGTTRIWLATRYYDGTNYQVSVYYSDGLTAAPTWTQSVATLDTAGTANDHYPTIVRFGSKIGVFYTTNVTRAINWRYRADTDTLTSWVTESQTFPSNSPAPNGPIFSVVSDTIGNIYLVSGRTASGGGAYFTYYNGSTWSTTVVVSSTTVPGSFTSISTDGTNVWVFYNDTTGLSTSLSGSRKLVYKKGVAPFATANFDTNATAVVPYHGIFDKVWQYTASSTTYTDETTIIGASASTTDTLVSATGVTGDMMYFGKTAKFDSLSWVLSTNGVAGTVVWEYWNGYTWIPLTSFYTASNDNFITGNGYLSFDPHTDWLATKINGESTNYYYIRARVTTAYSTVPVGTQFAAIPAINWANVLADTSLSNLNLIWTENGASATKVRFTSIPIRFVRFNGVQLNGMQVK